jgi:hypothetical protein
LNESTFVPKAVQEWISLFPESVFICARPAQHGVQIPCVTSLNYLNSREFQAKES